MIKVISFLVKLCYNLLCDICSIGGITIKRLDSKRKEWLEYQNRKHQNRIRKLNKLSKRNKSDDDLDETDYNSNDGKQDDSIENRGKNTYTALAPEILSITNNTEESIKYFNNIIKEIGKKKFHRRFYFDLSKVNYLSIDAIMYIIAVIRNIKTCKIYKYSFEGNQPINKDAKHLFQESGFFYYVNSDKINIVPSSNKIQIISGNKADTEVAKSICDFVNNICNTNRKFTFQLYTILIELMTNTIQHAYKGKDVLFVNHWYVFVEDQEEKIKFVFLDTGVGIPRTIHKKWQEKIPLFTNDSNLIKSALEGEFRSETREKNRGKGLPEISDYCKEGKFQNLSIYSGSGCCKIIHNSREPYIVDDFKNKIFGTLFSWEINKKNILEEHMKNVY